MLVFINHLSTTNAISRSTVTLSLNPMKHERYLTGFSITRQRMSEAELGNAGFTVTKMAGGLTGSKLTAGGELIGVISRAE